MTDTKTQIFLGGSCNPTTWRSDIAIPTMEAEGVSCYNPQVSDWHDGLIAMEAEAKDSADILLFVIDGQTRAVVSMLEAMKYIADGRTVVICIVDIVDATEIGGQAITGAELKDLNRGRAYLRSFLDEYDNAHVGTDVQSAVNLAIELAKQN